MIKLYNKPVLSGMILRKLAHKYETTWNPHLNFLRKFSHEAYGIYKYLLLPIEYPSSEELISVYGIGSNNLPIYQYF